MHVDFLEYIDTHHYGLGVYTCIIYNNNNTQPRHARTLFSRGILNTLRSNGKRRLIIYYMYLLLTSFSAQNTSREKFANVA